ncbi:centriolar coiled-coil protein of 110 kDa isoform X2 [Gouania willdenowi]|uniref:centriolar coiled-coil protein of 110 kDa isoform X2 n=1 Tax=Gouania willdenowi TaxID=441366 RepID=UPI001055E602|nr:centriolar coiled-coil protein of 110 kDa isoform X2 [Gouania willdenowi]
MCGCPEMESYEEFCLRSLALLQEEEKYKKKAHAPLCSLKFYSVIRFHGRAVLSPLLNAEQLSEMCVYKQRAIQREEERHNQQKNKLLAHVQGILDRAQNLSRPEDDNQPLSRSTTVNGYTLVTDSPGLPKDPVFGLQTTDRPVSPCSDTPILNGSKQDEKANTESQDKSEEEEEEEDEDDFSLDSLLKRSRKYVKREQSRQESKAAQTPPRGLCPVQGEKTCSPAGDTGVDFGFSLHHSPVGPPQIHHQVLHGSNSPTSGGFSPGPSEPHTCLRSPDMTQRRRPRPVSTGNIHISFPVGPAERIPQSTGKPCEGTRVLEWREASSGVSASSGMDAVDCSGSRRWSHCLASPVQDSCTSVSASVPTTTMGPHDHLSTGFRRRCHTLDNQLRAGHPGADFIDRSQERVPRFMAGVSWVAPTRRSHEVQLNPSYQMENPSPTFPRPSGTPDMLNNGRKTTNVLRKKETPIVMKIDETQWRSQAVGNIRKRLDEEQALQMSVLLAEQEKEQQCLILELDGAERRLMEQGNGRPLSADSCGWSRRSVSDSCPIMSPSCPGLSPIHTPSERPLLHNIGIPSPIPSVMSSPSVQPPAFPWGPIWGAGKPRARSSLVWTAEQLKACCRISAIVRGFLTRRLLKTEKVKHLHQTIQDTQEFIRSFQTEALQRRSTYTAQDLSLQERVRAQLRAALFDIHDIFFEMPLCDRLALLQQDRELRTERKLRDLEKAKCTKDKVGFSAATQRSMDRKKRIGESPAQVRKIQPKPKSPTNIQPTNRALKPSQGQNSPVLGQLNRQGSWNKKTPEERVKRLDSLKKQHSLG